MRLEEEINNKLEKIENEITNNLGDMNIYNKTSQELLEQMCFEHHRYLTGLRDAFHWVLKNKNDS